MKEFDGAPQIRQNVKGFFFIVGLVLYLQISFVENKIPFSVFTIIINRIMLYFDNW